jgi:hypothetical protein
VTELVEIGEDYEQLDEPPLTLDEPIESTVWNPRAVLEAVFGKHAETAYWECRKWARYDPERLRAAVSAACEWACDQTIRLHIDLDDKPGNYIRKGLEWELLAAKRDSLDDWDYAREGQACPECDGRGFDADGPCWRCDGAGILQKRAWVDAISGFPWFTARMMGPY